MRTLTPAERVIVAADFKPDNAKLQQSSGWVRRMVLNLAEELKGTGVYLKMNSALRVCGYELIRDVHNHGLGVCADLKFVDISETLTIDGAFLASYAPDIVTVMCAAGVKSLKAIKAELHGSEVIGVTVPTSFSEEETQLVYNSTVKEGVIRLASIAQMAGLDGLVSAATDAAELRTTFGSQFTLNAAAIRPAWHVVGGDDQNPDRIMTPAKALHAGATRIIIGRPITQSPNRRDAVRMTIDEVAGALESREVATH